MPGDHFYKGSLLGFDTNLDIMSYCPEWYSLHIFKGHEALTYLSPPARGEKKRKKRKLKYKRSRRSRRRRGRRHTTGQACQLEASSQTPKSSLMPGDNFYRESLLGFDRNLAIMSYCPGMVLPSHI